MSAKEAKQKLLSLASAEVAESSQRFFKTGPHQYGEGDVFLGVNVPTLRMVSREFRQLPINELEILLHSPIHEERHLALMILVLQVTKCDQAHQKQVFDFYIQNRTYVNNWDLVDCSAPNVVGRYLMDQSRAPLWDLAKSKSLWDRRIAIIATQYFIRNDDLSDTLELSQILLKDDEDLIHKATGWMLREVGQKDEAMLKAFLDRFGTDMPRTMLRYAIEKFPPEQRRAYLQRTRPTK
jgi:3-methyladenine DNA glycosylase AlkD